MSNHLIKGILALFLLIFVCFGIGVAPTLAHSPHDDIFDVEVSPTYQKDRTLFILVRGNLLKSVDGGLSWKRCLNGLDQKSHLYSLAISSQTKNKLFLSSLGDGIYQSLNGGVSWKKVNNGLSELDIDLIAISPNSDQIVFAAGQHQGLYKTQNSGKSWHQVREQKITAISYIPEQKQQIISGDQTGNLYLSNDGGEIWQLLHQIPDSGAISTIAISPHFSKDKTLLLGTEKGGIFKTIDGGKVFQKINEGIEDLSITSLLFSPNSQKDYKLLASTWHKGVYQSDDGGNTWQNSSEGLTSNHQADLPEYRRPSFSELKMPLDKNNQNQTIFLAGFNGLFKSNNGGRMWQEMDTLSASLIQGIAISPNYKKDQTVALTTYLGGNYLSQNGGQKWKAINKGLEEIRSRKYIARLFGIVFSPNYAKENTLFSASWTHFLKSTNGGQSWRKIALNNSSLWEKITHKNWWFNTIESKKPMIAVSPNFTTDQTIYLVTWNGEIHRSIDRGESFSMIGNVGHSVNYLVISPNFALDKTLYISVSDSSFGIYKTVDGGYNWQPTAYQRDLKQSDWIQLAISPNYQTDQMLLVATKKGLLQTENAGEKWQKIELPTTDENAYVEAVALSPNYQNDQTFVISLRGNGIFKTLDGGKSFTQIGDDLLNHNRLFSHMHYFPAATMPIQFSPSYLLDKTLYGFSGTELFKSTDGGLSWKVITIPEPQVKNVVIYAYARLTNSPIYRFLIASVAAMLGYFLLKRWKKVLFRTGVAIMTFIGVFIFLSTVSI
ncbi:glycosyl hydrolase [Aphanothece hegewaldii CCALA 016]|uniref:Glycosyl hydrolase n=1 Tax=Aphanothece hegewaldii CCALA 016 TaxID=2107694 RepID=A0A2T1M1S5_9CHRO|nr:YCF48-related protein [Aphanothece hegewaldii]PSF38662.1 glycosyl hydrolase [Aphanothece hegewaldii CCALA 016]